MVYLNKALVQIVSKMQKIVALSVTEAELIEGCECSQDMLFIYWMLRYMGLTIELPMILEIDNQGAIDIVNNWSSSGRTRHMDLRLKYLRELKEANIIHCIWCPTANNEADALTKNNTGPEFERHNSKFVDQDQYMISEANAATPLKGEGVPHDHV